MAQQLWSEFNELSHEHIDAIYGMAIRLTKNTARAEDLVHRTFFVAFNTFDTFDQNSDFEDWIKDICRKISK